MTKRLPCPPAPGPLEGYAAQFDPLFARLAQRRGLRAYLQGLLLPRDRNKTLTCLAGAEPVVGAQHGAVQGLQFFLSESPWDHEQLNQRRLELLLDDPATAPHDQGVLVIDDTGDRKDGRHTAHVARYTPACRLPKGKRDPGFRTKPQLAAELVAAASRPAFRSGRWWPTASTATTRASVRRWGRPRSPTCWRSSPARASGAGRPGAHPARGGR